MRISNTIRLLTYRRGNDIELMYSVIRIGRKDKIIDNESSGGVTTKINKNGCFIEWNARTELSQTAAGPAFGEFTEEILYKARTLPTTRYFIIGKKGFND